LLTYKPFVDPVTQASGRRADACQDSTRGFESRESTYTIFESTGFVNELPLNSHDLTLGRVDSVSEPARTDHFLPG
jgi:hypothetical protein